MVGLRHRGQSKRWSQNPGLNVPSREFWRFAFDFRRRNQGEQMSDFEIAEARSVSEQVHRQRIGQLLGN